MIEFAETLRQQGYRLTQQRLRTLEVLAKTGRHMSAEEIHEAVKKDAPDLNLSTVYRTMDLLAEEGIVAQAHLGGDRRVYELSHEGPHHHLVCRQCGAVDHMAPAHLEAVEGHLSKEHGFEVEETILTSFGLCSKCRRK